MHILSYSEKSPLKNRNEDSAGHFGNLVWVLDGSTPMSQSSFLSRNGDDLAWFIRYWNSRFETASREDSGESLASIVRRGIENYRDIAESMAERAAHKTEEYDLPSAALALGRFCEVSSTFEYFILADCSVLHTSPSGGVIDFFTDPSVIPLDRTMSDMIRKKMSSGETLEQAREHTRTERNTLRRKKRNVPGGYMVLGNDLSAVDYAVSGSFCISKNDSVYLYTDGFAPVFSYGLTTPQELSITEPEDACNLFFQLREREREDTKLDAVDRTNMHDDATILAVHFGKNEDEFDGFDKGGLI